MTSPSREPDQIEGVALPEEGQTLVGHVVATAPVSARLAAGRLPGGILVHGPRGIGKATYAFDLARQIFSATGDETPEHIAAQVAAGAYPNLFVMRKAPRETGRGYYTAIRVEEVRGFIEQLRHTRGRAGHRIAIIDSIDDCNASSANALLKILEEPPADTTFLLISHRPGSLLPTIRSRCFQVGLRPLDDADVRAVLQRSGIVRDAEAVDLAVALSAGRPRRALEALLLEERGTLTALRDWLADPSGLAAGGRMELADALGAERDSAELRFARDMLNDWLAKEARSAAASGHRARLASVGELWDKARLSLADADEYNLDMRQTLVALFDAIRKHEQLSTSPSQP